ncbi:MAG: YbhB/YbcL family Raf kinase inhibitor-like protein [Thermoguttaceae bacterium]
MKRISQIAWLRVVLAVGLVALVGLPGCGEGEERNMTMQVTSKAFVHGQLIPKKYTGEGADLSPPLAWSNVPAAAKELALICDDPDAPVAEPWVHWVMYSIPADLKGLPEGVVRKPKPPEPAGVLQGVNGFTDGDIVGYRGPMPPVGHGIHHYHFKLYALDAPLNAEPGLDKKALLAKMRGRILAEGELIGTYERKR